MHVYGIVYKRRAFGRRESGRGWGDRSSYKVDAVICEQANGVGAILMKEINCIRDVAGVSVWRAEMASKSSDIVI